MGPRAGLDRCGKSRPHHDLIPRPSSPWGVTILTELYRPTVEKCITSKLHTSIFDKYSDKELFKERYY
jgi:hypothetical protein